MIVRDDKSNNILIINTDDITVPIRVCVSSERQFYRSSHCIEISVPHILPVYLGEYKTNEEAQIAVQNFLDAIRNHDTEFIFK